MAGVSWVCSQAAGKAKVVSTLPPCDTPTLVMLNLGLNRIMWWSGLGPADWGSTSWLSP